MPVRLMLGAVLMLTPPALADGGYFFPVVEEAHGTAASADQRAVVVCLDGRETLLLQTRYEGAPGDFAWVIPTPSQVVRSDVTEGAEEVFDELARITAPRAHVWKQGGCLGGCASGEGGGGVYDAVNLWDQFRVGGYEVSVLSADESGQLAHWLADNGYNVPAAAEPVIRDYTQRAWFFVALKIDGAVPSGTTAPDPDARPRRMRPIRLTFATETPVFPMRISAVSTREQVGVHLYVIAPHRVRSSNYSTGQVQARRPFNADLESFDRYYESQLSATVAALGPRSLAVEYAAAMSSEAIAAVAEPLGLDGPGPYYLTRLSTLIRPEHMTEDIRMADAPTDAAFHFEVGPTPRAVATAKTGFVSLWLLGVVLHGRRARRRASRAALLLATVLMALAV